MTTARRRPPAGRTLLGLLAAAATLAVAVAPPAAAHADYHSSDPAQGARLHMAPHEVVVRFTERVETQGTTIAVFDAAGTRVDDGNVRVTADPPEARAGLAMMLPEGAYLVEWRTLSGADGHPTTGSFGFAVGNATPAAATSGGLQTTPTSMAIRVAGLAGWSLAFGSLAYAAWMRRPLRTRLAAGGALAAAAAGMVLQLWTVQAAGISAGDALSGRSGQLMALRWALALAGAAAMLVGRRWPALGAIAACALAGAAVAHPSALGAGEVLLAWVHVLAAGAWVGGLANLALDSRTLAGEPAREAGIRFGRAALVCVAIVATTGLAEGVLLGGMPVQDGAAAWPGTRYGQLLATKSALMLGMLALATVARFGLLRTGGAVHRLGRTAGMEAALGLAVLAVAGVLASTSPPVAGPDPPAQGPLLLQGETYTYEVSFHPAPQAGGHSGVHVVVIDATGAVVANETCGRASCLTLRLTPPGSDASQSLQATAADNPPGMRLAHVLWTTPGHWRLGLEFSSADVFRERVETTVTVS